MRFIQFDIVILVSVWLWSSTDGSMHLMLLKAIKHRARHMPTILTIPHKVHKGQQMGPSETVHVRVPAPTKPVTNNHHTKYIKHQSVDSYHQKRKHPRKVVASHGTDESRVKYVYVKGRSSPKKYHTPVKYSHHKKKHHYYHGGYQRKHHVLVKGKKRVIYEDDDHQFIHAAPPPKPRPRFSHVRIIHIDDDYGNNCPYLASKGWHGHGVGNSVGAGHLTTTQSGAGIGNNALGSIKVVASGIGTHKVGGDPLHSTNGLHQLISSSSSPLSPGGGGDIAAAASSSFASNSVASGANNLISIKYHDDSGHNGLASSSHLLHFNSDPIGGEGFESHPSLHKEAILIADTMGRWPGKEAVLLPGRIPGQPVVVKPGEMMIPSSTVEQLLVAGSGEPLVTLMNSIK